MIEILFWFVIFYLLFRFVFGFLVPVLTTVLQIRTKVKDMQGSAATFQTNGYANADKTSAQKPTDGQSKGDYIDFEEVK